MKGFTQNFISSKSKLSALTTQSWFVSLVLGNILKKGGNNIDSQSDRVC